MKSVISEINVGPGSDMTLFHEVSIDGETVIHREGDSLTPQFLWNILASVFSSYDPPGEDVVLPQYMNYDLSNTIGGDWDFQFHPPDFSHPKGPWGEIDSISGSNPITLSISYLAPGASASDIETVCIAGVSGSNNLNGRHQNFTVVDGSTIEVPVSATGSEDVTNARICPGWKDSDIETQPRSDYVYQHFFRGVDMVVGRNGSTTDLDDYTLREMIERESNGGELQHNAITVNAPVVDLNQQQSTIQITRELQNNQGYDIDVGELGLFMFSGGTTDRSPYAGDNAGISYSMISRDPVSATIPSGSTVSFSYKVRTTGDDDGGIMTNFNEMLYRQIEETNRTVQDINNTDQNDGPSANQYKTIPKGGLTQVSNKDGVALGTSTQVVDIADKSLKSEIPQGQNDGELLKVGGYVEGYTFDRNNSKAYFDLVNVYENRGSTTIGVNEMGFYTNGPSGYVMISRSRLSSQQDVAPGDTIEARYRVSVNL